MSNWLRYTSFAFAALIAVIFIGIIISLYISGHLAWHKFGWEFINSSTWNASGKQFGALSAILGTLISSAIALCISLPVSLTIATFATSLAPRTLRTVIGFTMQSMAGIPSIIYGMWGLFVLIPFLASNIEPSLINALSKIPLIGSWFNGIPMGIGLFTAGIILAIMITPLLTSMMIDLLNKVPSGMQEAAYSTGATHWEVIRRIKLPFIKQGILGSTMLGLGRALGETMAVTFVIGNSHQLPSNIFAAGNTIASTIANEFTEATTPIYTSSLMALGLILLVITFVTIMVARLLLRKSEAQT